MFEVGKKYQYEDRTIFLCAALYERYGMFVVADDPKDVVPRLFGPVSYSKLKEYKEPQKVEAWVNVHKAKDGSLSFGIPHKTKETALMFAFPQIIDTIKIEYTETI
jgi:hypothetical protein